MSQNITQIVYIFSLTVVYRCYTGGKNVTLNMWDMSGDSRYDLIAKSFFERAHCILFCFDFTRETTFQKIKQLVDKADEYNKNHSVYHHSSEWLFLIPRLTKDNYLDGKYDVESMHNDISLLKRQY